MCVQEVQQKLGVLDLVVEGSVIMGYIVELESQFVVKWLELGQFQVNVVLNCSCVLGVQGDIQCFEEMLIEIWL